jgi:tripartite-type tricarboxylate transporter receptor subunit TctC
LTAPHSNPNPAGETDENTPLNRRQSWPCWASTLALPSAVWAQPGWKPTQTITYVIGVAAGGSVDLYARGIKSALETLNLVNGQTVVADNKPGAGGLLALQQLQRSRGNAHNLGTFHTGSLAGQVTGILKADMREYVPVAMLVEETTLVAVRADSPLKTAKDLLAALQARSGLGQDRRRAAEGPEHAPGHCQTAEGGRHRHHQADGGAVPLLSRLDERAARRPCGCRLRHGPTVVPMAQAGKVRIWPAPPRSAAPARWPAC